MTHASVNYRTSRLTTSRGKTGCYDPGRSAEGSDLENETQREPLSQTVYDVADELRAIALLGLRYAEVEYDRERYDRVLRLSARLVSAEQRDAAEILAHFRDNLLHISPLAGAEAAVFRDGKLLLLRRHDDGLWALPGGLVEV